ncbi:MAG: VWA domain-containing protein [Clostridia bacterium]|nr:VWA domain-containing protein [Clostridia bacterium]
MSFINPLGLLGLIGVPIIIIIYILRNKYNEQTVPSTYIWELSERFYKRRNPLSAIAGIISLILQLLLVVSISLAIARPVFVVPDSAGEYCLVIDSSASMSVRSGLSTRHEKAKSEALRIINDAADGSTFTLIHAAGESTVVYERLTDKRLAREMLAELECSMGTSSYSDALKAAQKYFDDNSSFSVYLFTDKEVAEHENLEIVNVSSQNDVNFAINNVTHKHQGGELSVECEIISYGKSASVEVALYLDGSTRAAAKRTATVEDGKAAPVSLSTAVEGYQSYRIAILNSDALAEDNEYISYNHENETSYSVLIVSETPFFFRAVLDVLTDAKVDVVSPAAYTDAEGYGLAIFHSYTPSVLPDCAVWLVNSTASVEGSGFGARGSVALEDPGRIVMSSSTATAARKLLEGVGGKEIYIGEYVKYSGMYTKFTTLFTYDSSPVIFAGTNALGNREVVIGFDIHKADIALSTDFAVLMGNLLDFSCPDVFEGSSFTCGTDAVINVTSRIKNVKAVSPSGEELYIDTSADVASFRLSEVGTYTVSMTVGGEEKTYKIYSGAPAEESDPYQAIESFSLAGERGYLRTDGEFDPVTIIFIALALLFTADWMVYCYEKYQLR